MTFFTIAWKWWLKYFVFYFTHAKTCHSDGNKPVYIMGEAVLYCTISHCLQETAAAIPQKRCKFVKIQIFMSIGTFRDFCMFVFKKIRCRSSSYHKILTLDNTVNVNGKCCISSPWTALTPGIWAVFVQGACFVLCELGARHWGWA